MNRGEGDLLIKIVFEEWVKPRITKHFACTSKEREQRGAVEDYSSDCLKLKWRKRRTEVDWFRFELWLPYCRLFQFFLPPLTMVVPDYLQLLIERPSMFWHLISLVSKWIPNRAKILSLLTSIHIFWCKNHPFGKNSVYQNYQKDFGEK